MEAVGFVALSRMHTMASSVIFVEALFVRRAYRGRGIGRELLQQAAIFSDGTDNQQMACVVRRHAAQQQAARGLYQSVGMRPRRVPRLRDAHGKEVQLRPMRARKDVPSDAVEVYLHGPRAEAARLPRLRPSVVVDGRNVMTPAVFIRKHPGLLRELRRHHSCAGGDGADADGVLLKADVIMPAFIRS